MKVKVKVGKMWEEDAERAMLQNAVTAAEDDSHTKARSTRRRYTGKRGINMDGHDEQDGARLESGNESCKSCASMLHREAEQNAVTVMDQENDTLVYQLYCLTGEEIGGRDGLQPRENRCVHDHEAGCAQRAPTVVMRWFS